MTWTVTLETFCPGGDADICKFISLCSDVLSPWNEQIRAQNNTEESTQLCLYVSTFLEFFRTSLKLYGEKLLECSSDPMQFVGDSTAVSTKFCLKKACAVSIELCDLVVDKFLESLIRFNAIAVLQRRSTTSVEYKFGAVSKLHFTKSDGINKTV